MFGSGSKSADDKVLNDNYNEIIEFLDEYYGKPHSTPKPVSRFKVSRGDFFMYSTVYNSDFRVVLSRYSCASFLF